MKRILTIAGSDSGGGAGIQADLKTITVLGGYGMSVITALTAQNTMGVRGIHQVPLSFIEAQVDAVISDIGADALKTGMLATTGVVELVARKIHQYGIQPVVVDPVMVAKSGDSLLAEDARSALKEHLLPLASVITPNLAEASVITGMDVKTPGQMRDAAMAIHRLGAACVLVKGGHMEGDAIDLLYDGKNYHEFHSPRIQTANTHGTGCAFSSAIATFLAQGMDVVEAVAQAKQFITRAIRHGLHLGSGHGPANPYAWVTREAERYHVLEALRRAFDTMRRATLSHLIPEVQSNLGFALSFPEGPKDVAAWPCRIMRCGESVAAMGCPEFGASRHVASIILTAMQYDPTLRAAANIRFSKEVVQACKQVGLKVASFDRALEPEDVRAREGSSLSWGVAQCMKAAEGSPDIIFDRGGMGKEPMVRVLGCNPMDVVQKIILISEHVSQR